VDVAGLLAAESAPLAAGGPHGLVSLQAIHVTTVCPHHLLPAMGHATLAYLPGDRLVGIGTLARVVDAFARRLTLQEAIGEAVVRALVEQAGARGAYVRLELRHACLAARGARQTAATVVTVARAGVDIPDAAAVRSSP
jgi:GTP cyclohydrolase I